jgi:hypothetical protein
MILHLKKQFIFVVGLVETIWIDFQQMEFTDKNKRDLFSGDTTVAILLRAFRRRRLPYALTIAPLPAIQILTKQQFLFLFSTPLFFAEIPFPNAYHTCIIIAAGQIDFSVCTASATRSGATRTSLYPDFSV